jgi:hypothetical protein
MQSSEPTATQPGCSIILTTQKTSTFLYTENNLERKVIPFTTVSKRRKHLGVNHQGEGLLQ